MGWTDFTRGNCIATIILDPFQKPMLTIRGRSAVLEFSRVNLSRKSRVKLIVSRQTFATRSIWCKSISVKD
jgi:hypothetical protein